MQVLEFGGLKMKLKKIIAGFLLVLALTFPHAISAADFNLNMKTVLTNLHSDVKAVKIDCAATKREGGLIGKGSTTENVSANGEINKAIPVKFNASSDRNPADAKIFSCSLSLIKKNGSTSTPLSPNSPDCISANNGWRCGKQGTSVVYLLEWDINPDSLPSGPRSGTSLDLRNR
jgi:hypothetical protein